MPRTTDSKLKKTVNTSGKINWAKRAEKIRKFRSLPFNNRTKFTPAQKQMIARNWLSYKYLSPSHLRKVSPTNKKQLKEAGFRVEEKGLVLESMTGPGNKKIKGARIKVRKSGVITQSIKGRKDYYIPLTGKKRAAFIFDPEGNIKRKTKSLKIRSKRKWVYLVVDGKSWGKQSISGASLKLQSFRDKNPGLYKKSQIAIKIVTMKDKPSYAKKKARKRARRRT